MPSLFRACYLLFIPCIGVTVVFLTDIVTVLYHFLAFDSTSYTQKTLFSFIFIQSCYTGFLLLFNPLSFADIKTKKWGICIAPIPALPGGSRRWEQSVLPG
jgi:hypothetical protein